MKTTAQVIDEMRAAGWARVVVVTEEQRMSGYKATVAPNVVGAEVRGAWTLEVCPANGDEPLRMRARRGVWNQERYA